MTCRLRQSLSVLLVVGGGGPHLCADWSQPAPASLVWTAPPGPPTTAAFRQSSSDLRAWLDSPVAQDSLLTLTVDRAGRDGLAFAVPITSASAAFYRLHLVPFRTFPVSTVEAARAAIQAAQPGDAIVLADGIWSGVDLTFNAAGRPGAPILLRPATPGGVTFTGPTRLRLSGRHLIVSGFNFQGATSSGDGRALVEFRDADNVSAQYCRLTQTAFVDCNPPSPFTRYPWVSLYGTDNRVDHNYFRGQNHSGVTVVVWLSGPATRHRIDRNHFAHRPESPDDIEGLDRNGWETIRIGDSNTSLQSAQNIVERNLFTECNGEIEIISNKSGDNQYLYNTFVACVGTLTLRHGDRNRVEGNIFLGQGLARTGGIRVIGEDHIIVNNVVDGTDARGGAAIALVAGIENTPLSGYKEANRAYVAHNTLRPRTGPALYLGEGLGTSSRTRVPVGVQLVGNLLVRGAGNDRLVETAGSTVAAWSQNLGFGANLGLATDGLTTANPNLVVDPVTGLPSPGPGSPARALVTPPATGVLEDVIGRPRPQPATSGAWESDPLPTSLPLLAPLSTTDVGPAWRTGG